jgi:hypothetical protein
LFGCTFSGGLLVRGNVTARSVTWGTLPQHAATSAMASRTRCACRSRCRSGWPGARPRWGAVAGPQQQRHSFSDDSPGAHRPRRLGHLQLCRGPPDASWFGASIPADFDLGSASPQCLGFYIFRPMMTVRRAGHTAPSRHSPYHGHLIFQLVARSQSGFIDDWASSPQATPVHI